MITLDQKFISKYDADEDDEDDEDGDDDNDGDDCNIEVACGATYFARSISASFSKKLTNKLELELENQFTTSYASKPKYGHEFTSTLTFRPSDSSGFNTSFEYENDYQELSHPEIEHSYTLKVGYDF